MKASTKNFWKPILTLAVVCLFSALALAFTDALTRPIIEESEAAEEKNALRTVCPDADVFTALDLTSYSGIAKTVTAVYETDISDTYVFRLETAGYAAGIRILCAIGEDGKIIGVSTLSTNETDGYGKRCENPEYAEQYAGEDASLAGVDAISGATKTTKAYEGAVRDAFAAYRMITGGTEE